MEDAAAGGINGGGQVAFQHNALPMIPGINGGHGGHQRLGVGVGGMGEKLLGGRLLHQMAQIHHAHAVGDVAHHAHVVSDEQVGQPALILQILQQVDDLGLYGHIQGGNGLVAHHHLGVKDEGAGQADALALSAAELVGIAIEVLRAQTHLGQHGHGLFHALGAVAHAVDGQHLHQRVADALAGIEGGIGILENDLHILAEAQKLLGLQVGDVLPEKVDGAAGGLQQADHGAAEGALAAAAFTHQAIGFARPQLHADAVDGLDMVDNAAQGALHREPGGHIPGFHDDLA